MPRPRSLWFWNLPVPLLLALRYARSTRKDASVRFLSTITAGGIGLGVAALILAVSALSGFQATLLEGVLARSPLLQVEIPPGVDVESVRRAALDHEEVRSAQVILEGSGWVEDQGRLQGCRLYGLEREVPRWFPGAAGQPLTGLFIADSLALRWGLTVGESVRIVSPRPTMTPFSRQLPSNRKLAVVGVFSAGGSESIQTQIALPLATAEGMLWGTDRRLDIDLPTAAVERVAEGLRARLPEGARVLSYRDLNRGLFFALRLEKALMFVGVFLIVLVASQTLVSSLAMIIANKRRELGALGTLGMAPEQMRSTFMILGGILAGAGILGGGALGCVSAWALDRYQLIALPEQVYIVDFVPFLLRPVEDLSVIVGSTILLTLLAARSAGRRASLLSPAQALRR